MNWKNDNILEAGRRFFVKNIAGADPHRIFSARSARTPRGIELRLDSEGLVLRGRDMRGILHAALAN